MDQCCDYAFDIVTQVDSLIRLISKLSLHTGSIGLDALGMQLSTSTYSTVHQCQYCMRSFRKSWIHTGASQASRSAKSTAIWGPLVFWLSMPPSAPPRLLAKTPVMYYTYRCPSPHCCPGIGASPGHPDS